MTWDAKAPYKPEVAKCRPRLVPYCRGLGLDIGCGPEKILPDAIGVDRGGADVSVDLSRGLGLFADQSFDYVFSSHCLEDFKAYKSTLADWWRLVSMGGHLVLYLPHKDLYPRKGQPRANLAHQHDFEPQDILDVMNALGGAELIHSETHSEDDEYSFELVFRRIATAKTPLKVTAEPEKKALVIRYGAYGDHIIAEPVARRLKEDGYHVTYNCTPRADAVIKNNPHIDQVWHQDPDVIPNQELEEYWRKMGAGFDKVVNLSESLEGDLLAIKGRKEYFWSEKRRRKEYGRTNYYAHALAKAGYEDVSEPRGRLYPDARERELCRFFRDRHKDKFMLLWGLSGSAIHKAYPFAEDVALALLNAYEDIVTVSVGDYACKLLEWQHPRAVSKSAEWGIRDALLMTEHADMVVAPETGLLNAAGCFNTPKLGMLTHSNKINLTKYFINDHSIQAQCGCSPCHRLIYVEDALADCPKIRLGQDPDSGEMVNAPACVGGFPPGLVFRTIERVYLEWHEKRGTRPRRKVTGSLLDSRGRPLAA